MVAQATAGLATRLERCQEHNVEFAQVWLPSSAGIQYAVWAGQCPKCAEDERLSGHADYILRQPAEAEAIQAKVLQIVQEPEYERSVQALADAKLAEYLVEHSAEWRAAFEAEAREERGAEVTCDVEFSRKLEIIEGLRKKQPAMAGG
jgi:hypothetical protein